MDSFLREATYEDVDLLYEWVNDETTRKSAFDSHEISYVEHVKWFEKNMNDTDIHQYIFVDNGKEVGQIRVNIIDDVAELDYSIAPGYRLLGYGRKIIFKVIEKIKSNFNNINTIRALVKPENVGSITMLKENGFSEIYDMFEYDLKSVSRIEENRSS